MPDGAEVQDIATVHEISILDFHTQKDGKASNDVLRKCKQHRIFAACKPKTGLMSLIDSVTWDESGVFG